MTRRIHCTGTLPCAESSKSQNEQPTKASNFFTVPKGIYPWNDMTPNTNSAWNHHFKKSPLSYRPCAFLGCTAWAFNRFDPTTQKNIGASPHPDGKVAHKLLNITLMQSNMGTSMKILKSCSKVLQRTLRSSKTWLRYPSFSVISRVKWTNLPSWSLTLVLVFSKFW